MLTGRSSLFVRRIDRDRAQMAGTPLQPLLSFGDSPRPMRGSGSNRTAERSAIPLGGPVPGNELLTSC
jgi:hypothetical protein